MELADPITSKERERHKLSPWARRYDPPPLEMRVFGGRLADHLATRKMSLLDVVASLLRLHSIRVSPEQLQDWKAAQFLPSPEVQRKLLDL